MPMKPLFLGLFRPPKPFEDRVSLQGTWSAVIGRKALNLSCPKVKLCRETARDPSRDKPRTLRFVGSSILENGCWIAGRLVVAMLIKFSSRKRERFRCFYTIRSKMADAVCAHETRDKLCKWLAVHVNSLVATRLNCFGSMTRNYEMQIAIENQLIINNSLLYAFYWLSTEI